MMKQKISLILSIVTASLAVSSIQAADDYTPPRTEYGQPDLQGVWNFSSNTPMQRPERFGTQEFLTFEEVQAAIARQESAAARADAAAARLVVDPDAPPETDNPGGYNDFWMESAGIGDTVRTSLIVYPENGRIPDRVEGAQRQFGGLGPDIPSTRPVRFVVGGIAKDGPEDRGLSERCIVGFNSGPPFTPSLYNNNMQIFQNRDTAVIMTEMIHDARIVRLGDKPELTEDITLWSGDSRGWWEGDTLVVETKNFNGLRQTFSSTGSNEDMVLTEKFTRSAFDTVDYEFTIDDPSTFTDKITAIVPMTKLAGQIYEYACHEGNYGMFNILRGKRMEDRRATESGGQ
ncbi:MAG: hypothetical protein HOA33_05820 [Gammaproteobacteria bacterium]|jgi:hypothetical protein|nr:hypothetical protein [Gammaproteobacteria bacterium]MBT3988513.1 hypothetical protein [Gammaproteobacteria bacterium]MBT4256600.1 hypothetical protein [Gammaproteobacteria bacterium]MBT5172739.1 hypothetical protein [Gammaproteobacteria bacterium]MBT5512381.1 hypothetical protein [Gammaproteobacteria bacterium]